MNYSVIEELSGKPNPNGPPRPKTLFEILKAILPIVLVVVAQLQGRGARFWVLVGFAGVSFLAGYYRELSGWVRQRWQRWQQERTARQNIPALGKFVKRFGEFVSLGPSNTLHYIIESQVFAHSSDAYSKFGLPSLEIFHSIWDNLRQRAASDGPKLATFNSITSEFSILVSLYNNHCMRRVFEVLPRELKSQRTGLPKEMEDQVDWEQMGQTSPRQLSEEVRRTLNAYHLEFNAFLNDYESFLREFEDQFADDNLQVRRFPRVKAL